MTRGATVTIRAEPEQVWAMVSDITRMGEWSPETERAEWLDGAGAPVEGARFRGYNRRGSATWSTACEVIEAEPGRPVEGSRLVVAARRPRLTASSLY